MEAFQEKVLNGAREECGLRKLGVGRRRKSSEWWRDEVKQLVREKRACNLYLKGTEEEVWSIRGGLMRVGGKE